MLTGLTLYAGSVIAARWSLAISYVARAQQTGRKMSYQSSFDFIPPLAVGLSAAIARRSDPESSHRAGGEITVSGRREGQLLGVLALVRKYPGSTSLELAYKSFSLDRYVVARRLPELEKAGLVSRGPLKQCGISKKLALTWVPARKG
jgi:hypothetical protein